MIESFIYKVRRPIRFVTYSAIRDNISSNSVEEALEALEKRYGNKDKEDFISEEEMRI